MKKEEGTIKLKIRLIVFMLTFMMILPVGCRIAGSTREIDLKEEPLFQTEPVPASSQLSGSSPQGGDGSGQDIQLPSEPIICEIKGHVSVAGVYSLPPGSRVADLIVRSGGVLASGSLDLVNQARKLEDGEVVVVPSKDVSREEYEAMALPAPPESPITRSQETGDSSLTLININTASEAELQIIPGVGPATARNIINYRNEQGPFIVIEDLKKVDRIGDKTFEKLREYITVSP